MTRSIFPLLICIFIVSACGPLVPATPAPLPTQSLPELNETWTLRMSHTGGIMGLSRSIEVSSDGTYMVTDEREKNTVEGQLSSDELASLRDLLTTTASFSPPSGPTAVCADCFVYAIEIDGAGKPFNVQVDDTTIAASGLEPLVTFLRGIMEKALK